MSEGIHPRLKSVIAAVDNWCKENNISYDVACDESDIQGVKLFQKNRMLINRLFEHITPFLEKNNVHLEHQKVRGGTILAFSLEALAESRFRKIIAGIGEEIEPMTFEDRIADAMARKPLPKVIPESPQKTPEELEADFLRSATRIIEGKDSDEEESESDGGGAVQTKEAQSTKGQTSRPTLGPSKGATMRFEHRILNALGLRPTRAAHKKFRMQLREALDGIATPTGTQPSDLFAKFARALRVLGDQMGTGPLQDLLKQQGINWKKSDDGQSIILYIVNAQTNAPQPIARISAETLESPRDFEDQLTNMLDFAKGDAPGAFKQKQQEIKDQEKAVRDIARAVSPQDRESEVARQMNLGMGQEQDAAQTAAMPKSQMQPQVQSQMQPQRPQQPVMQQPRM